MRGKLGVFLMESPDGEVAVQLFGDLVKMEELFDNLKKLPGGGEGRSTLLALDYEGDGVVVTAAKSRDLPEIEDMESRPDGIVLGGGPINLKEDEDDDGDREEGPGGAGGAG